MAARNSTSRARRASNKGRGGRVRKNVSLHGEGSTAPVVGIPRALHCAIETERSRLMDAEAILHCVVLAVDQNDGWNTEGPYYQGVIGVARDMLATAINQLDSLSLRTVLRYVKETDVVEDAESDFMFARKHEVRETPPRYLH